MRLRKTHDFNPEKFLAYDAKKKEVEAFAGLDLGPSIEFSRTRSRKVFDRIKAKFVAEKSDMDPEKRAWVLSGIARAEIEAELRTLGITADTMLINQLLLSIVHEPRWQRLIRKIME